MQTNVDPTTDARTLTRPAQALVMMERRTQVVERMTRGLSYREIANELGMTLGQVNSAARAAMREAKRTLLDSVDDYRARLLAKNHATQAELWRAYDRVRQTGKVSRTTSPRPGRPQGATEGQETKEDPGPLSSVTQATAPEAEAKFLAAILKAQEQEAKILGVIGADTKKETDQPATTTVNVRKIIIMNNAQLSGGVPWLDTIPPGYARQGVGLLPPSTPEPAEAEVVRGPAPAAEPAP